MAKKKAYSTLIYSRRKYVFSGGCFFFLPFIFIFFTGIRSFAQEEPEYDEISVFLDIPQLGGGEISAVIKREEVYLPVTDLFDFLKIRNIPSPDMDIITGFFISPDNDFKIDRLQNSIKLADKVFELEPGALIRTESNLYLKGDYFGRIFGLDCIFSFRNLSVTINTRLELPAIKEMRQQEMRRNINRLKGEVAADTIVGRSYPLFHFGMADWSVISTEQINGPSDSRVNLSLGSIILGGETSASLYYDSRNPFSEKQQYFLWRRVNNDNRFLRQSMAGKIATHATSSMYNPVVGVQFTNTPTTFRRSFGSYTLSDKTEPGWIVELYVNNVLVNYAEADASGFFSFEVPLVYGNSLVVLKYYGPWGEERTREQNIIIPFNFIPKNTMEYSVGAGIVEDTLYSRFARTSVNYGLTRGMTVGAGFEYLSSVSSGPFMPYVNASVRLTPNLLFMGEYTHTVRLKGTLTYRLPSNIQFDLNYIKYAKDQKAINFNYLEERKAVVTIPLRLKNASLFNRISVKQLVLPTTNYTTGEWTLSGSLLGVNANITTFGLFIGKSSPYLYSNLSFSIRLPSDFKLIPQAQYGYSDKEFISTKVGLEKRLLQHGFINLSYERNFRNNMHLGEIGFRYDFKFAQVGFSARQTDKITSFIQYARGSLINDRQTGYLGTDNRTNVGRGGISIVPYLDINNNGKKDPGEPKAYGLNLRASGGRVERSEKDTIIRILNLEPYTDCFIEFDANSFENITWRLKKHTMKVAVDPNMLKMVEIPILVVGEASGTVMIDEKNGETQGIARIIVNFFDQKKRQTGRALTEQDGYFSYFGLPPGSYTVRTDTAQMRKLGMISSPDSINFNISPNTDGDFVDGLDFKLRMADMDSISIIDAVEPGKPVTRKDTTLMIIHEVVEELVTITEDSWAIQLGAFRVKSNAERYRRTLEKLLKRKVNIVIEDNFWKVRIPDLKTREEVDQSLEILKQNDVTEVWVITLKAKQQQLILTEKQDTVLTITETNEVIEEPPFDRASSVEVGSFDKVKSAISLKDTLFKTIHKPVLIIREEGMYKVRITGFENNEDLMEFLSSLRKLKLKELKIQSAERSEDKEAERPEEMKPDTIQKPVVTIPAQPPVEEITPAKEPTFALQVGIFNKKSQAMRAMKKITSKLNLPVDVVLQWDYYHVLVTGFYTREETFRYYPELAGIGYPRVTVIENYKKEK